MNYILIALAFLTANSLYCLPVHDTRMIRMYRTVPLWEYNDYTALPFILNMAATMAKDTDYHFDRHEDGGDLVVYKVYNQHCFFLLIFDVKTRACDIEFNAEDDSFDYVSFKKLIDFFL